jgi:hypothetical protein
MKPAAHSLKLHMRLSLLILLIGILLMATHMYLEDEPGAIPLVLIVVGLGWLTITRFRLRRARRASHVEPPG